MKVPEILKEHGLESPVDYEDSGNLILSCEAETGCGKSDFMLRSAPTPMLVIDLDRNSREVARKYRKRDMLIKEVSIPPTFDKKYKENQSRDYKILMGIQDLYTDALESGAFQTIFIDTFDALYELARRGILGGGMEFGDVKRTDFSPVNSFMKQFFDLAKERHINFCASLHMKDEYKGSNATGKRTRAGWKGTIQCTQCHFVLFKDDDDRGLDRFHMKVVKCTLNANLEGREFQGEEISFDNLRSAVYEEE